MLESHKYFTQFMLRRGCVTEEQALNFFTKIRGGPNTLAELGILIIQINREISSQHFKIASIICEVTGNKMVVLVNTKNDVISASQLTYSAKELEYFQAILQEIMHSECRKITFIVAINITSSLTCTFSRDSGQKALNSWIKHGYYVKEGDFIHLGPRLILEFTSYLKSQCPDFLCHLCTEVGFTGKICATCSKLYHLHCLEKYLQKQKICPNCKSEWSESETFQQAASDLEAHSDSENEIEEPRRVKRTRRK